MRSDPPKSARPATRVTHLGRAPEAQAGFINPPVYHGSTVLFDSAQNLRRSAQPYVYGRKGTPTTAALEDVEDLRDDLAQGFQAMEYTP